MDENVSPHIPNFSQFRGIFKNSDKFMVDTPRKILGPPLEDVQRCRIDGDGHRKGIRNGLIHRSRLISGIHIRPPPSSEPLLFIHQSATFGPGEKKTVNGVNGWETEFSCHFKMN